MNRLTASAALLTLLLSSASAVAVFTPTQLAKLVATPDVFKPTKKYTDSKVNAGFGVYSWVWGKTIVPDVQLQRSSRNTAAWELVLGNDGYVLTKLASQRKLLAVVSDDLMNVTTSIYLLTNGPLKGTYALDKKYSDGSGGVTLQTKAFALAAANGSEFRQDTPTKLLSYPLYGVLNSRGAMCALPEVSCK